jgi:hypothetical protein
MKQEKMELCVSTDGPENIHDRYRRLRNGRGERVRLTKRDPMPPVLYSFSVNLLRF